MINELYENTIYSSILDKYKNAVDLTIALNGPCKMVVCCLGYIL